MRIERDTVFSSPAGFELAADFFLSDQPGPLLILIHGGGWISGDRTIYEDEAHWLLEQGISSATVSYRLAPLHRFPAAVQDLQAFVDFVREGKGPEGVSSRPLVAVGNSAGGHLAAMLALTRHRLDEAATPWQPVNGAVAICPITDITQPREKQYPVGWSFLEQFMGGLDLPDEQFALASPIHHASASAGPIHLLHGTEDDIVPVSQSESLAARLKELGVDVQYTALEGEYHGFSMQAWTQIRQAIVAMARRPEFQGSAQ